MVVPATSREPQSANLRNIVTLGDTGSTPRGCALWLRRSRDGILNVITSLITAMGVMGLALAIVGLYGLVAYGASRRTREIGIRIALGAARSDVLRMVLRQGMPIAVAGLAVGLLAGAGVSRALRAVFPEGIGGDRTDVVTFALVTASVLAVTFLAAFVPARRASRIQPTEALRYE